MDSLSRCKSAVVRIVAALLLTVPTSPRAALPEPPPPQAGTQATPVAPDTSTLLPRWLHLHASFGYGWIQGPALIRKRYEAGQDFVLGLEVRPRPRLRVRFDGEYQVLPAVGQAHYGFVTFQDLDGGQVRDTLSFDWRRRGWLGAARLEAQWRALPHTWLMGGVGRGYLDAGVRAFHFNDPYVSLDVRFPGSSGWAWITSAGVRYDIDVFGPVLGAELRWSALDRPQDRLQTWSLRIGWQGR